MTQGDPRWMSGPQSHQCGGMENREKGWGFGYDLCRYMPLHPVLKISFNRERFTYSSMLQCFTSSFPRLNEDKFKTEFWVEWNPLSYWREKEENKQIGDKIFL